MTTRTAPPRSIYAAKLGDFAAFAFADEAAFAWRGRWAAFFGQRVGPAFDGRVVLEVGCADAAFLAEIARRHPDAGFVGLDWKCKALHDGARRTSALGLRNVALLRGRGQDVLRMFADAELDEAWVFHPDPCHRDAELANRLVRPAFLADVHRALKGPGSVLALKTDHPGYYQWVLGLFGLPEPAAFAAALAPAAVPQPANTPRRVRARELMRRQDVPPPDEATRARFDVAVRSHDYWADAAAQARTAGRCFAGTPTPYEARFAAKRRPIYYVEMRKR